MTPTSFLHEHKDFKSLLEIVSSAERIQPQLVEKDYWIMHCLYGLLTQEFKIELKGGTSLSKGFKIIDRFSEDIDIKIEPPEGLNVKAGPNHDKAIHIESRRKFFDWLAKNIRIPGVNAERDTQFDSGQMRGGGVRLYYKSHYNPLPKLKEGILLEVGFDQTTPNKKITISSWALDRAQTVNVAVTDNRAIDVPCYLPQYTLVEKLQAISTKYRQQQQKGRNFPPNFLRHYYDVFKLLDVRPVQEFIGSAEYLAWKEERFRGADNRDIATNEAFSLPTPETRTLYETEYLKGAELYYRGQVPFGEILASIAKYFDRL